MAPPTKDQLVALGKLSPPLDPVTEGDLLHLATGLVAVAEYGAGVLAVLDAPDPLAAVAQFVLDARGQEQTGPLTGATDAPPPGTPGVAVAGPDPRDAQIAQLQEQLAAAQADQVAAAQANAAEEAAEAPDVAVAPTPDAGTGQTPPDPAPSP